MLFVNHCPILFISLQHCCSVQVHCDSLYCYFLFIVLFYALGTQASHNLNEVVLASASQSHELPAEQEVAELNKDGRRKEIAPRSEMWQHFTKIKDDAGIVRHARCKYCHRNMKAEAGRHGTSSLKRHFTVCKRNPHKFNKDPTQGTLQATHYEGISTWRFDQDALKLLLLR